MTDRDFELRERLLEQRIHLLEERLNQTWVPSWPGLLTITFAVTVATVLLLATSFSEFFASAQREPLWTVLLCGLLLIVALGTGFAVRAAHRLGESGEHLHLRAKALSRRLDQTANR